METEAGRAFERSCSEASGLSRSSSKSAEERVRRRREEVERSGDLGSRRGSATVTKHYALGSGYEDWRQGRRGHHKIG